MGFSAKPQMIIGVRASEIVTHGVITEAFDKYDERGNKTGQVGHESKIHLTATVNGTTKTDIVTKLYSDTVSIILDITDSPSLNKFGVINTMCDGTISIDDMIVGIPITSVDVMQNETTEIGIELFNNAWMVVIKLCKEKFGKDIEPKMFLYANSSY